MISERAQTYQDAGVMIKRAFYDTQHGQLHCHVSRPAVSHEQTTSPVLLLHMSASSSKSWLTLMRQLSNIGFSCFAPDMPGFGESSDPKDDPAGITWYSDLYHAVFSSVPEFTQGCHVIGHHSGAVIGTDLAARYGGFVESLTLVGPVFMSAEERRHMADLTMGPLGQPTEDGSHLTRVWEYLIEKGIPRDNVELLQREALDHLRAWRGRLQIYACVWAFDCAAATRSIDDSCKVLALCARDDILWPFFENAKSVRESLKTKEIKGANFGPDLGTSDILEEFLALVKSR